MTDPNAAAYAEAQRLIAEAHANGSSILDLSTLGTRHLDVLPPEISHLAFLKTLNLRATSVTDLSPIATLFGLNTLNLWATKVADLGPIRRFTSLDTLYLFNTPVIDLTPLTNLTALKHLDLSHTQAMDLAPLSELFALETLQLNEIEATNLTPLSRLKGLRSLFLNDSPISDVTPLSTLTNLRLLWLNKTSVKDLRPLKSLTKLTTLNLTRTQVTDLSPLTSLTALLTPGPKETGLTFGHTPACENPRIAEIAEIKDPALRAQTLFDYLQGIGDEPAPAEDVTPPPRQPAPLETDIVDDRLVVAVPANPPLPAGPVDDRARKGWAILKQFRADFANALNITNYRPLASAIAAFDRAMGDRYDHLNEIAVGLAGERLSALSKDAEFVQTLPEGAGTELATLGAAVSTFANRFPDWLAYLNDPAEAVEVAATVQDNLEVFTELEKSLAVSDDVAPEVLAEYRDEIELVRQSPNSEPAARALLASTCDLIRTLAENALIGMRLYAGSLAKEVKYQSVEFAKIVPAELRKKSFWGIVGITGDIVFNKSTYLLMLSTNFPPIFGWIPKVLAALGLI